MGNFSKSLSKELGKNTGKWISNKVFGTGHSTPHKIIIQQERSERKAEREKLREDKLFQKELDRDEREREREYKKQLREAEKDEKRKEIEDRKNQRADLKAQKEAEIELNRWLKEQEKLEKENEERERIEAIEYEKNRNFKIVESFNEYIDSLKSIHKNLSFEIDWNSFLLDSPNFISIFKNDYIQSIEKQNVLTFNDENLNNLLKQAVFGGIDLDSVPEEKLPDQRPSIYDEDLYVKYENYLCKPESIAVDDAIKSFEKKHGQLIKTSELQNKIKQLEDEIQTLTSNQFTEKYLSQQNEINALLNIEQERNTFSRILNKSEVDKNNNRISALKEDISKIKIEIEDYKRKHLSILKTELEENEIKLKSREEINLKQELYSKKGHAANDTIEKLINSWNAEWIRAYNDTEQKMLMHYLAIGILNSDKEIYNDVLKLFPIYDVVGDYGSSISVSYQKDCIEIDLFININDVVPINKKSTTKDGKLFEQIYSSTERNLLIQDYICSMTLRLARETFSIFNYDKIIINAIDKIINKSNGNIEDAIILSTLIDRHKLNSINFERVDPSDCIETFEHNMNFNKSNGFLSVSSIPYSKLNMATNLIEKETINSLVEESSEKELTQSIDIASEKEITISASMTVSELKEQIKKLFSTNIEIYTTVGNVAGEGRKLRALTELEIKGKNSFKFRAINNEALTEIKAVTGLTLKFI